MKRLDFSFRNSESEQPIEAVQRTTFTSPIDIVGKTRITRFKLSEGAFPLAEIGPSKAVFTLAEKNEIDAYGKTPSDLYFAFCISNKNAGSNPRGKAPCGAYRIYSASITPLVAPIAMGFDTDDVNYGQNFKQVFFINEAPVWKQRLTGWVLVNKPRFLYNLDDLYDESKFTVITSIRTNLLHVSMTNTQVMFQCNLQVNMGSQSSTPVLLLSETFMNMIKQPLENACHIITSTGGPVLGLPKMALYYPVITSYTFSKQIEGIIASSGNYDSSHDLDFSTIATFNLPLDKSHLFPYTAILIMFDEFNNPGERLVVNNTKSSGVVDLSTLSISKLFIVGQTNYERGDFIYVNDSLQETPLLVNLPRQCSLTIRLYFLLKDNSLKSVMIPKEQNFFLQLSIE